MDQGPGIRGARCWTKIFFGTAKEGLLLLTFVNPITLRYDMFYCKRGRENNSGWKPIYCGVKTENISKVQVVVFPHIN